MYQLHCYEFHAWLTWYALITARLPCQMISVCIAITDHTYSTCFTGIQCVHEISKRKWIGNVTRICQRDAKSRDQTEI
jgi:hypothetical protein